MAEREPEPEQAQGYPPVGQMGEPVFHMVLRTWQPTDVMRLLLVLASLVIVIVILLVSFVAAAMNRSTAQWFGTVFPIVTFILGALFSYYFPKAATTVTGRGSRTKQTRS